MVASGGFNKPDSRPAGVAALGSSRGGDRRVIPTAPSPFLGLALTDSHTFSTQRWHGLGADDAGWSSLIGQARVRWPPVRDYGGSAERKRRPPGGETMAYNEWRRYRHSAVRPDPDPQQRSPLLRCRLAWWRHGAAGRRFNCWRAAVGPRACPCRGGAGADGGEDGFIIRLQPGAGDGGCIVLLLAADLAAARPWRNRSRRISC